MASKIASDYKKGVEKSKRSCVRKVYDKIRQMMAEISEDYQQRGIVDVMIISQKNKAC